MLGQSPQGNARQYRNMLEISKLWKNIVVSHNIHSVSAGLLVGIMRKKFNGIYDLTGADGTPLRNHEAEIRTPISLHFLVFSVSYILVESPLLVRLTGYVACSTERLQRRKWNRNEFFGGATTLGKLSILLAAVEEWHSLAVLTAPPD